MRSLVISRATIENIFWEHGITPDKLYTPDPEYSILQPEWFEDEVLPMWSIWRDEYLGEYVPNETDCDDFGDGLKFYVKARHRRTPGHPLATPAVCQFILPRGEKKHDLNALVTKDRRLIIIEPQVSKFIELTREEIQLCQYAPFA